MKADDLYAVQNIIEEVAATEIMPRFRKLEQGDIEMKGVDDPVTVADKAAEEALIARLQDLLPGSVVVGEECCAQNPSILSNFEGKDDVWVIDPIDGTRNFIEGRREFGVMVAHVRRKETVAAWIHDPNTEHTLAGERGSGVWLQGSRMHLAAHDASTPRLVILGSRLRSILTNPHATPVIAALPALAIGSAAAYDYARLFVGDVCFANSTAPRASWLLYRMSKPWDHVPGLFLQNEANGYSADFFGNPYDMQNGKTGLLLAADKDAWSGVYNTIRPVLRDLAVADA
ncbi:MAG: inositol monophosphatase [Alphaproteobacteria bacterium]|nr:inositol monophosphatase [Alphaproteobacteria bacterium]